MLAFIFVLTGCMLGPDFSKPEAPLADHWLGVDGEKLSPEQQDSAHWWTVFDDPVLNALIETAYQQNLSVQIAGIRILEARANLGIAIGNIFPQGQQLSAQATSVELSDHAPNAAFGDTFFYDYRVGFDAAWELDVWGRYRRGIDSAGAEMIASVASYDDALVATTAEVARTYILIRTFEERLELARENVKIQKESLRIVDSRYRHGVVTQLDVAQAKALLNDTQALIPTLNIGHRQAKHALSVLLGIPPSDLQDQLASTKYIPTIPRTVAVGMPAELLRRRPDIRQAELAAAAQSERIGIAKSDLYPRFSLLGSIGLRSSERARAFSNDADIGALFDVDSVAYTAGPSIQWPILNYGRLKNNVRVQDARFQQLLVNYHNTVLDASREVEDALVGFTQSQDQVAFLTESVNAAKRSVELSLIQYRDGAVDYQRVLDSQEFLVRQQDRLTSARGDVALNLAAAYKALGGGWEIRQGRQFIPIETQETMKTRTDWGHLLDGQHTIDAEENTDASDEASPVIY